MHITKTPSNGSLAGYCSVRPLLCAAGYQRYLPDGCTPTPRDSDDECWTEGMMWAKIGERVGKEWAGMGSGRKFTLTVCVPLLTILVFVVNIITLYIISSISASMNVNPYRCHCALVVTDLFLVSAGAFRLYYEFLGIRYYMLSYCGTIIGELSSLVEPVVVGLLNADQAIVLLVVVGQLLLLHRPQIYISLNTTPKTLLLTLATLAFSQLPAIALLKRRASPITYPPGATLVDHLEPEELERTWASKYGLAYDSLDWNLRDIQYGCFMRVDRLCLSLYVAYSSVIGVLLVGASVGLYLSRRGLPDNKEDFSAVVLAEAALSIAATLSTNLLLSTIDGNAFWCGTVGLSHDSFQYFILVCETCAYFIVLLEVFSHLIFFLLLSRKFRERVQVMVCGAVEAGLDAHTLHTVPERARPPKAAKHLESLVLQDIESKY